MEISNSLQSTNSLLLNQMSASDSKKVEEEKESQKIEGYNTTSKLYRELSEDISKYATANPTQDKYNGLKSQDN